MLSFGADYSTSEPSAIERVIVCKTLAGVRERAYLLNQEFVRPIVARKVLLDNQEAEDFTIRGSDTWCQTPVINEFRNGNLN